MTPDRAVDVDPADALHGGDLPDVDLSDSDPGVTAPGVTAPGDTAPGDTAPGDTAPGDTASAHEPADAPEVRADPIPDSGGRAGGPPAQSAQRWRLEDRAEFYRRSLADAEAEHDAGDLADDDYEALVRRDRRRLAAVEVELERLDQAGDPVGDRRLRRRHHRRVFLVVGVGALVAAAAIVLILHLIAPSLPGQPFSGSTTVNLPQKIQLQLSQADQMVAAGNLSGALAVYQQILTEEPHQVVALTERGWLEYAAGVQVASTRLIGQGRASIEEAQSVAPDQAPAHLLLGIIALQQNNDAGAAVAQFTKFLADHPSATDLAQGAPYMRRAYALAGLPVPAQVPAVPVQVPAATG